MRYAGETMRKFLKHAWTTCPVTALIVMVAIALYVAVQVHEYRFADEARESLRACGAATQRVMLTKRSEDEKWQPIPQLSGPFDLWEGQWWRVIVSGFHHGDLLHLAMNSLSIWFMGQLLEPRMRRLSYLTFFMLATTVSMLPEFLLANSAIGLSGGAYAMFGVLMVLRRRDAFVASVFTDGIVKLGLVWLVGCILLTQLDILRIANAAHFCGFVYGWVAGQLLYATVPRRGWMRFGFLAAHLAIIPAFYYVMHPVWNGRYHWYLARRETDPRQQIQHLENAVNCDPGLAIPWSELAKRYGRRGQMQLAWKTVVTGLNYNRSDDESIKLSRFIWAQFDEEERKEAFETFKETFHDNTAAWQKRLGLFAVGPNNARRQVAGSGHTGDSQTDTNRSGLEQTNEPPPGIDGRNEFKIRDLRAPQVDPDRPTSAAEGVKT